MSRVRCSMQATTIRLTVAPATESARGDGQPAGDPRTVHPTEARTLCRGTCTLARNAGIDRALAVVIIAELGVDMSPFPTVSQLASWAGVCPGNNESAGKRNTSRIPKGNVYLKTALVEAANAAARAKGTYRRDKFYRLKARRGYKASGASDRPQDPRFHLPHVFAKRFLQRLGRSLSRQAQLPSRHSQPRPLSRTLGLIGHINTPKYPTNGGLRRDNFHGSYRTGSSPHYLVFA
jgi:transposase IS116/IS110/IS902 family protein